jgi:hypothetical protein
MEHYSISKYFTPEECFDIIEYCMQNGEIFKYKPSEHWDCRQMHDNEFKEKILKIFINHHNSDDVHFNLNTFDLNTFNVSLTRYYEGRFLNLHKDVYSQLTTVIVLSEDFDDGRFVLSNKIGSNISDMRMDSEKLHLNIGEGISFNGSAIFHGVMPVHTGIRCALNLWMSDETQNRKINKTLI